MRLIIILGLLMASSYAFSNTKGYYPAAGFIVVSSKSDQHMVFGGTSMFCMLGKWAGDKTLCKYIRAQEYIKYKLDRDDITYIGMTYAPYTEDIVLYFKENFTE